MRNHTYRFANTGSLPPDRGPAPCVINIKEAAEKNCYFRAAIWTGCHLQTTLMSIGVGDDIGVELHADTDQYIRVEAGQGAIMMGRSRERLDMRHCLSENSAVFVPAGTWHNVVNTGTCPLKLSSVYAPPHHPRGTVHATKQDADKYHG